MFYFKQLSRNVCWGAALARATLCLCGLCLGACSSDPANRIEFDNTMVILNNYVPSFKGMSPPCEVRFGKALFNLGDINPETIRHLGGGVIEARTTDNRRAIRLPKSESVDFGSASSAELSGEELAESDTAGSETAYSTPDVSATSSPSSRTSSGSQQPPSLEPSLEELRAAAAGLPYPTPEVSPVDTSEHRELTVEELIALGRRRGGFGDTRDPRVYLKISIEEPPVSDDMRIQRERREIGRKFANALTSAVKHCGGRPDTFDSGDQTIIDRIENMFDSWKESTE